MAGRNDRRVALGFSVHTGWAAVVALGGGAIVDRRRIEMMGDDRAHPRFVYHNARELSLDAAKRSVKDAISESLTHAKAALKAAIQELEAKGHEVVAGGVIVGNKPVMESLETILASHSLIHSAEGELFRNAVRDACKGLKLPIVDIPAKQLETEAARVVTDVEDYLEKMGRAAGRPWAKDQKDACLAATVALRSR